jgi:hypothetical protein
VCAVILPFPGIRRHCDAAELRGGIAGCLRAR